MQTISLQEFICQYYGSAADSFSVAATEMVDGTRQREDRLRHLLPAMLVRRLDRGFARSNTVAPDTGNALQALCRVSNAQNVFETGTYWGYSTAYLAAALRANNASGKVWTFDIYPHAGKHIPKDLLAYVELIRGKPSVETMPGILSSVTPDVVLQDSRHDYEGVADELRILEPALKPGAVVMLHDFVEPEVRRAAQDCLPNWHLYTLATQDPQQLGVAIKRETVS